MQIDIISFTNEQYAALSEEQIQQVKNAQIKKNALSSKLEAKKLEERHRLLTNGMFLSDIWAQYCEQLDADYYTQVEQLRDSLLFYLQFSAKPEDEEVQDAPYTVDYSLDMAQRYYIVRDYYIATYTNPEERVQAFRADVVARQYLGEMYATLYDYLLAQEA